MSATFTDHSSTERDTLYLAFDLSWDKWTVAFSDRLGRKPWRKTIEAGKLFRLQHLITQAKVRFGLAATASVRSCYEAGRDGFWLHRYLLSQGIENQIVDSASIEVNRRQRRSKSDKLDVGKLLTMLCRWWLGDQGTWSVVRVPTEQQEDDLQRSRELEELTRERTRLINRIRSHLAACGQRVGAVDQHLPELLQRLRQWNKQKFVDVWPAKHQRILRELERLKLLDQQMAEVERQCKQQIRQGQDTPHQQMQALLSLYGVGTSSAQVYAREFGWRQFANRRQIGSFAGLCPSKYQSGQQNVDRGISKAGSKRLRRMLVQLAWGWLRHQPQSELARWYQERFGAGSKRWRKVGIVALARKLLIALWRYVQTGQPPAKALVVDWRTKLSGRRLSPVLADDC